MTGERKLGQKTSLRFIAIVAGILMLLAEFAPAATVSTRTLTNSHSRSRKLNESSHANKRTAVASSKGERAPAAAPVL